MYQNDDGSWESGQESYTQFLLRKDLQARVNDTFYKMRDEISKQREDLSEQERETKRAQYEREIQELRKRRADQDAKELAHHLTEQLDKIEEHKIGIRKALMSIMRIAELTVALEDRNDDELLQIHAARTAENHVQVVLQKAIEVYGNPEEEVTWDKVLRWVTTILRQSPATITRESTAAFLDDISRCRAFIDLIRFSLQWETCRGLSDFLPEVVKKKGRIEKHLSECKTQLEEIQGRLRNRIQFESDGPPPPPPRELARQSTLADTVDSIRSKLEYGGQGSDDILDRAVRTIKQKLEKTGYKR